MATARLCTFLNQHGAVKGGTFTHTRIGSKQLGIGGGCYNIPPDKREAFYDLYLEHLKSGRFEYLTEAQGDISPLVVDLDFRYDSEVEERQHSEGVIQDLVALYTKAIVIHRRFYKRNINQSLCPGKTTRELLRRSNKGWSTHCCSNSIGPSNTMSRSRPREL